MCVCVYKLNPNPTPVFVKWQIDASSPHLLRGKKVSEELCSHLIKDPHSGRIHGATLRGWSW